MTPISIKFKPATLVMALATAFPFLAYAAAGSIDYATGEVKALTADGRVRRLTKGDEFHSGETIETGNGRAWLRFTDGAQVSLQPQSQYRIDNYQFNGKADGEEKGFFSLLKGGLRTITGLVGRTNRNNYKVNTAVATIGIRGTEYSIQYGNSITVSTGEGSVEVCNGGGCLTLTSGESAHVANKETRPTLSSKKVDLPPPPQLPLPQFSVSNNTNSSGSASVATLPSGPGYAMSWASDATVATTSNRGTESSGTSTFDSSYRLSSFNGSGGNSFTSGTATDVGTDGMIGWGRWTTGTGILGGGAYSGAMTDVAYVTGIPTTLAQMPTVGSATYMLTGGTSPMVSSTPGTLNSASLTANFASGTVGGVLGMSYGTFTFSGASISGNSFSASNVSNTCSMGACTGDINGFFAGAAAARAAMSYRIDVGGSYVITGAAAFKK